MTTGPRTSNRTHITFRHTQNVAFANGICRTHEQGPTFCRTHSPDPRERSHFLVVGPEKKKKGKRAPNRWVRVRTAEIEWVRVRRVGPAEIEWVRHILFGFQIIRVFFENFTNISKTDILKTHSRLVSAGPTRKVPLLSGPTAGPTRKGNAEVVPRTP